MKRPTITFTDEMYEKLEKRMSEKDIKSISECIREMVSLAFRIEEAAKKSNEKEEEVDLLSVLLDMKKLLKNNLVWSLEAKLLAKFLVETTSVDNQPSKIAFLEQYKNKAQDHVSNLMEEAAN